MKKILSLTLSLIMLLSLASCKPDYNTFNDELQPEENPTIKAMPSFKGTSIDDVLAFMKDRGFPEPEKADYHGGYLWSSSTAAHSYKLVSTKNKEIAHAEISIYSKEDEENFLPDSIEAIFGEDDDGAKDWVISKYTVDSTTKASAKMLLKISHGNDGLPITLIINSKGYEQYIVNQLHKEKSN